MSIRKSNIEVLRIISILMIIASHVANYFTLTNSGTFNQLTYYFFRLCGEFGVMCFVLISGYFMITSKFNFSKLCRIIFQILFYSVLGCVISVLAGVNEPNLLRYSLFPLTYNNNWFATAYVLLYLFSPFINKFIHSLSEKSFLKLLLVLFFTLSILPNLLNITLKMQTIDSVFDYHNRFSALVMLTFLYMLGAYIQKYPKGLFYKKKACATIGIFLYLATFLSEVILYFLSKRIDKLTDCIDYFRDMNSAPLLIAAFFTFLWFKEIKMKPSVWINTLAASTFGVYLIHCNAFIGNKAVEVMVHFLGTHITGVFLISGSLAVLITFLCTTLIDYCRINLLEKPLFRLLDRPLKNMYKKMTNQLNLYLEKIQKL